VGQGVHSGDVAVDVVNRFGLQLIRDYLACSQWTRATPHYLGTGLDNPQKLAAALRPD
jgi:hypothetical protein